MRIAQRVALAGVCALTLAAPQSAAAQLRAVPFASGLNLPVAFAQDPATPSIQYVAEQRGRVRVIRNGSVEALPFLDLSTLVSLGGERGLLGLAFAPDYGTSGRFFVCYTRAGSGPADEVGDLVISRYQRSSGNPLAADPASRKDLVFGGLPYIEHSGFGNHNGGHLAFGPDGYLYIAMGDGGGGNDPTNNAQNPATLLGKILRVDVNVATTHPAGYSVPPDNPFLDGSPVVALPEIWAFGVRNPWKFSFDDGGTGALLIADVGQGAREEVNYEPAGAGGRNYGWRNKEGTLDNQGHVFAPVPPAYPPLIDPVYEYDHSVGSSITGGFVYRGTAMRARYRGRYFFADFVRGRVWSLGLTVDSATGSAAVSDVAEHTAELDGTAALGAISSFGRDARGELYIVSYAGTIFRIVDAAPPDDVQLVIFNYNGDAWKDVLLYNRTRGDWILRLGSAAGTFTDGTAGGWAPGWQVSAANFNADDREDLFLYSASTGAWFKAISGPAGFSYFGQGWQPGLTLVMADFNGDARADVFAYNAATGVWFACTSAGDGTGGFDYAAGGWRQGWQVLPADFDADGRTDFLLYDPASGAFFKAITRGTGVFAYVAGGWAPGWTAIVSDLDGNSRDDVFLYNTTSGIWYRAVSVGDGTGGFSYTTGGWSAGWSVRRADFDGDGRSDCFLYNANGVWYKVINTGSGFSYFTGGWSQWETSIADLDGDGSSDVFLFDPATGAWYQAFTTTPGAFRYTAGWFPR